LRAAEEDFKELVTYIALDNPSAAIAVADKLESSMSNLSISPFIGKVTKEDVDEIFSKVPDFVNKAKTDLLGTGSS
jgi:plasmid stabilization system protein ParE